MIQNNIDSVTLLCSFMVYSLGSHGLAHQAPRPMEFSRQEYWSGLPLPSPGHLPYAGMEAASLVSPALAGGFFTASTPWEVLLKYAIKCCYVLAPDVGLWGILLFSEQFSVFHICNNYTLAFIIIYGATKNKMNEFVNRVQRAFIPMDFLLGYLLKWHILMKNVEC